MEFASVFSALRRENGYSQRKVANDLGISQALLSHYENGVREPRLDFIVKACRYYGVTVDYMLGVSQVKENPYTTGSGDNAGGGHGAAFWEVASLNEMLSAMALALNTLQAAGDSDAAYYAEEYLSASVGTLLCQLDENLCGGEPTNLQKLELQAAENAALRGMLKAIEKMKQEGAAPEGEPTCQAVKDHFARLHYRAAALK